MVGAYAASIAPVHPTFFTVGWIDNWRKCAIIIISSCFILYGGYSILLCYAILCYTISYGRWGSGTRIRGSNMVERLGEDAPRLVYFEHQAGRQAGRPQSLSHQWRYHHRFNALRIPLRIPFNVALSFFPFPFPSLTSRHQYPPTISPPYHSPY